MKNFDLIIEAGKTEQRYWLDLWRYRELFFILAWRDIAVRYKQTVLGIIWAIIRPTLTMIIFVFIFGKLAKLPTNVDAPYALLVFAALVPWYFFSTAISDASGSMLTNANLISKVYFPRIIIPTAAILAACIDFLIALVLLAVLMLAYSHPITWQVLAIPLFYIMLFILAWGLGIFFAALNVKYLDFKFVIPFCIQIGLYISPIGFSSSIIPEQWMYLFYLNPLVGIIEGFRWAILGGKMQLNAIALTISLVECLAICVFSIRYFRNHERSIADTI